MAVTYNAWGANLAAIHRVTAGGVWSDNLSELTAFDYFTDAPVVGDCLYFAGSNVTGYGVDFRNLRLFIGTPLAATSISVAWEYYTWEYYSGAWYALPGIVDGTNAFQNAGQQDVTWTVPLVWRSTTLNGLRSHWMRCRITAIDTPTEGGAQSTQAVQAGDNTIRVTGTGNTFSTIYNADVAGGWGVFENLAQDLYRCRAAITLGDGTASSLSETSKTLLSYRRFYVGNQFTLTLGRANDSYDYLPCNIVCRLGEWDGLWGVFASGSVTYMYGSLISDPSGGGSNLDVGGTLYAVDSDIRSHGYLTISAAGSLTRCVFHGRWPSTYFVPTATVEDCVLYRPFVNTGYGSPFTWRGIRFTAVGGWNFSGGWTVNIIDGPVLAVPEFSGNAGSAIMIVRYQHTFGLAVGDVAHSPIENVRVVIEDATGATVLDALTDANGQIVDQTLWRRQYWCQATTTGWTPIVTDYTPHTVTLSKAGYKTRVLEYTMDQARDEVEMLEAYAAPVAGFAVGPAEAEHEVQFADASVIDLAEGDTATYAWDFGDGIGVSSERNPRYEYAAAGTYDVTLTVTTSWGGSDSEIQSVVVDAASGGGFPKIASVLGRTRM